MQPKSVEAIRFAGPPSDLAADVDLTLVGPRQLRIVVAENEFPLRVSADGETITRLAFSMPDETPPGEHKAQVLLDDARHAAVVTIELRTLATIEPSAIAVTASAGRTVAATLRVTNRGNGPLTLDADKTVTRRESGTLGHSLASALKRRDLDLADRLIALGTELQRKPSHEVPVTGRMSPATLDVGAESQVTVKLAIPEDIDIGTTWSGSFGLLGTRVRVSVEPASGHTRHLWET